MKVNEYNTALGKDLIFLYSLRLSVFVKHIIIIMYFIQVLVVLTLLFAVTFIATDGARGLRKGPRAVDEEEYNFLLGALYF